MTQKQPNPIDKHVGNKVRQRRMMANMSQETLADGIGVTFQQVQKYEKGTNRIGASRLQQIARVLGAPIESFFAQTRGEENGAGAGKGPNFVDAVLSSIEGMKLVKAFARIETPEHKRALVNLAEALATTEAKRKT